MALGYWLDAEQHVTESLAAPDHPWVMKNSEILKQALVRLRTNIGEIVVTGSPPGARVILNRRPVGVLPLAGALRVAKGKLDVEVSATDFATFAQSVHVKGGDRVSVTAALVRTTPVVTGASSPRAPQQASASSAAPSVSPPAGGDSPAVLPREGSLTAPEPGAGGGSSVRRTIGWGLGAAAGVALVGAVVETVLWQRKRSQFNGTAGCYEDVEMRGPPGCSSLFDAGNRAETIALIGYAATALLAGSATALLLTGNAPEPRRTAMACAPGVGSALMSCRLSF